MECDMILMERAANYNTTFPKWPPLVVDRTGRWLYGMWMMGNNYQNKNGYYGEYPPGYLRRIRALFPDKVRVLHLFAGKVDKAHWAIEYTLDRLPKLNPDICVDVTDDGWEEGIGTYDLILADPPYSEEDAKHYGTCLVSRNKVVKACVRILTPGGHLVWLDQVWPMFKKTEIQMVGTIGMIRSTNHRVRTVFIFEK